MRGNQWMTWFRDEVQLAGLPLDWMQAVFRDGLWQLGMGFSGTEARRGRIAKDLGNTFGEELELSGDTDEGSAWFGRKTRRNGFLNAFLKEPDYFHLFVIAPTSAFLQRPRLQEALTAIPDSSLILHPVGGDAHLLGPAEVLTEAHIDRVRRALAGTGGYLMLERVKPEFSRIFGSVVPLPGEFGLQVRLKQQLDPRGIFAAPFYNLLKEQE